MLLVKEKLWLYLEAEKNEHLVNRNLHLQVPNKVLLIQLISDYFKLRCLYHFRN